MAGAYTLGTPLGLGSPWGASPMTALPPEQGRFDHADFAGREQQQTTITAAERQRLRKILADANWTFAKSVPEHPHAYAIRGRDLPEAAFEWAVSLILRVGYVERFWNQPWHYVRLDGYRFWPTKNQRPDWLMLNRAVDDRGDYPPTERS